jgi:hypothetical protein
MSLAALRSRIAATTARLSRLTLTHGGEALTYQVTEEVDFPALLDRIERTFSGEENVSLVDVVMPSGATIRCAFGSRTATVQTRRATAPLTDLVYLSVRLFLDLPDNDVVRLVRFLRQAPQETATDEDLESSAEESR